MNRRATGLARAARRGLTLLELLMVMTIIGLVFGLGLGALSTMDLGRGADAELLRGALRAARTAALAERHPAALLVVTDPDSGRTSLVVQRLRTLGTWHFERPDGRGTAGLTAAPVRGARQVDDGLIGRGVGFFGAPREARVEIAIESQPAFDLREGFSLELALRLEGDGGGTVFRIGRRTRVAGLEVTDGGGLVGWVAPTYTDSSGRETPGGRVDLVLPAGTLERDRWTRVALVYDRTRLRLVLDGFLAGAVEADGPLARVTEPLVLGGEPTPFPGSVDTLVLRGVDLSDPLPMSETLTWPADAPRSVRFDADGALDRLEHGAAPLEILLPTELDEPVTISSLGVVR